MIRRIFTILAISSIAILGCQESAPNNPVLGEWDLVGKPGTIFNKGIAVFNQGNYAWIDANIFRYRISHEQERTILHLDGINSGTYHMVEAHPDTLIISDGLNAQALMVRSRSELMSQYIRIANRDLERISKRYGTELGKQLTEGKKFLQRRYQ